MDIESLTGYRVDIFGGCCVHVSGSVHGIGCGLHGEDRRAALERISAAIDAELRDPGSAAGLVPGRGAVPNGDRGGLDNLRDAVVDELARYYGGERFLTNHLGDASRTLLAALNAGGHRVDG